MKHIFATQFIQLIPIESVNRDFGETAPGGALILAWVPNDQFPEGGFPFWMCSVRMTYSNS